MSDLEDVYSTSSSHLYLSATSLQSSYPYSFQELCFSVPASPSFIISMKGVKGLWALALQASIHPCSTKQSDDKKTDSTHVWRLMWPLQVSGFKMWMLTVIYATNKCIGKNIIKNKKIEANIEVCWLICHCGCLKSSPPDPCILLQHSEEIQRWGKKIKKIKSHFHKIDLFLLVLPALAHLA